MLYYIIQLIQMQIGLIIQKLVAIIYMILDNYGIKSMYQTFSVIENNYDMYISNLICKFYFLSFLSPLLSIIINENNCKWLFSILFKNRSKSKKIIENIVKRWEIKILVEFILKISFLILYKETGDYIFQMTCICHLKLWYLSFSLLSCNHIMTSSRKVFFY